MSDIQLTLVPPTQEANWFILEMQAHEDYNGFTKSKVLCYTDYANFKSQDLVGNDMFWGIQQGYKPIRMFGGVIDGITKHSDCDDVANKHFYTIDVTSPVAQLCHTNQSRSFKRKSVLEIIQECFKPFPRLIVDFSNLKNTYNAIDYVAQYNQSDFSFLQVLCAEYGLFYYVSVDSSAFFPQLKITLGDDARSYGMHPSIFHYGVNSYKTPEQSSSLTNVIFNIYTRLHGAPNQFLGDDYNPKNVYADLSEIVQTQNNATKPIGPVYVFPLNKNEYDPENKRIQRVANAYTQTCKVWSFQTTDEQLCLGEIIQTEKNNALGSIKVMPDLLLPISMVHEAKDYSNLQSLNKNLPFSLFQNKDNQTVASYDNTISAIAWNLVPYIPLLDEKHKAVLPTTLSGVVVGRPTLIGPGSEGVPPSTDLAVDRMEQFSVAMHWDFANPYQDFNSTPYMRMLSRQNGIRHLPHVGDEVIVSPVNNRPDRFVVLGAAYNSQATPPLKIGKNSALAGIKTASEEGDMPHYFYGDQTLGEERLVMQSSGNYTEKVGNTIDSHLSTYLKTITQSFAQCVKGDMTIDVQDKKLTIKASEAIIFKVGDSRIELLPDRANFFGDVIELQTLLGLSGPLATVGSAHSCPAHNGDGSPHVGGPVTSGSSNVFLNDIPAARVGDSASCQGPSDTIVSGNPAIRINGQSAAIVNSPTGHGGSVTSGVANVIAIQHLNLGLSLPVPDKNYDVQVRFKLIATNDYDPVITHAMLNLDANPSPSNNQNHPDHPTDQLRGKTIVPGVKGGSYDLRLSPQDRELAIYSVNGTPQFPYYKATVAIPDANNPDDKTIIDNRKFECKVLWPIMVLNCRVPEIQKDGIADTPEDLLDKTIDHTLENPLDPLDIKYFKMNGNNVTVFIHGYNVEAGELVGEVVSLEEVIIPQAIMNIDETSELDADMIDQESRKKGMITSDWKFSVKTAPYKSSILRDFNMVSTQINQPIDPVILANTWDEDGQDNELNGSGAFNWFLHMEKNINQAAGADFTNPTAFETYTRLLHVTWSGDQGSPNYMESVDEAFMSYPAKKLANALAQLKNNGLEVNVIAHSLGNGFLLKTLQVLHHDYPNIQLDHVFMWDAAVPNNVFNRPKPKNNTYDRWDFKNTLNAMQKLTVLHSYNDNILGPFATGDNQKAKIEDVDKAKPVVEWFSAYLCNILNLESLYCIAMALGVETHLILRPEIQEMAYQSLLQHRQDLVANNDTLEEDKADFEKGYYMPTLAEQMRFVSGGSQQSNLTAQIESGMHTFSKDIQDESSRLRKYFILHPQLQTFLEPILIVWDDATRAFKQLKKAQGVDDTVEDILTAIDWMKRLLGIILTIGTIAAPEVFIQIDIQVALMMLDFEELCESEKVIGYAVKAGEAIENIQGGIDSVEKYFGKLTKFMSDELTKHQVYGAAYLVQMLTDKRINAFHVPAMGYKPDDSLLKKNKSKINYVNQTEWLFEHSGMRIPSKDLMQHIYQDQVMSKKVGIKHFGSYP